MGFLQINPAALLGNPVTEVRVFPAGQGKKTVYSGYFTSPEAAAAAVKPFDGQADIYMTVNEVDPALACRTNGGRLVRAGEGDTTKDTQVLRRRWFYLDFDPKRVTGVSSTDAEKAAAFGVMEAVFNALVAFGFSVPVIADSGNGYHLLFRVDLENTDETTQLLKALLNCIADQYSTPEVQIDRAVFNAARITKFYGVLAVKGQNVPERPHRRSGILTVPDVIRVTPPELLRAYVEAHRPAAPAVPSAHTAARRSWDFDAWLNGHGIHIRNIEATSDGGRRFYLADGCPFDPAHAGKDAVLYQYASGAIGFKCLHASCAERTWRDFRLLYEPDAYDQKRPSAAEAFRHTAPAAGAQPRKARIIRMEDVQAVSTRWLWYPYIPSGKLTLMQGDPGQGKTMLSLAIAALVTRGGPFPGEEVRKNPGVVVYQTAEDGIADTIKPRLERMNPDFRSIVTIDESEEGLTLLDERIREVLEDLGPRLLIIDPLQAYLGANVDMHRANEVRPVLSRIGHLAEQHDCAVLLIMHMSKMTAAKALYRGLGSIDIPAAARSILVVGKNPEDPDQKIMAHEKSSLARNGRSVAFRIDQDRGIVFDGFSDLSADQILSPEPPARGRPAGTGLDAREFLRNFLEERGGYARKNDIIREAAQFGLSDRTLQRARVLLDLKTLQFGFGAGKGAWWMLPEMTREQIEAVQPPEQTKL